MAAAITGYTANYKGRDDHHLGRLEVEINAFVVDGDATRVRVNGAFGLRDWSGDWDDHYEGVNFFTVIAE